MSRAANIRLSCPECGSPRNPSEDECTGCGSLRTPTAGFVKPTKIPVRQIIRAPFPWGPIKWPTGGVLSLTGGEGLGKSSILGLLNNPEGVDEQTVTKIAAWISTEQDPSEVAGMFDRLQRPCPPVYSTADGRHFEHAMEIVDDLTVRAGDFVVVDSITKMGGRNDLAFTNHFIATARKHGWRGALVSQLNAAGKQAGSRQVSYNVAIRGCVDRGPFGRRIFRILKSRWGMEHSAYYKMGTDGLVRQPDVTYIVHSVEGEFPEYELVPYGFATGSVAGTPGQARSKRVQYTGLLDALGVLRALPDLAGYASSATPSVATENGFLAPEDEDFRRKFAEEHGLKWLDLEAGLVVLEQAKERDKERRAAAKEEDARDRAAEKRHLKEVEEDLG